jgi:hypothetical protein
MKTTLLFVSIFLMSACGSSSGGTGGTGGTGGSGGSGGSGGAACANPGGAVSGAMDTHCADNCAGSMPACDPGSNQMCINQTCVTAVQQSMCAVPDAGPPPSVDAGPPECPYGPTNNNAVADDDDCKYHVTWTSTPICENTDVFFTVVANYRNTNASAGPTGAIRNAMTIAEVFLNDTHPAPNSNQTVVENPPGTYKVGPIRFDAPGKWTVRFHYYEDCQDTPSSPHGHSAFYVNVP